MVDTVHTNNLQFSSNMGVNVDGILLVSAARTLIQNVDFENPNAAGIYLFFSITAVPTVETLTLSLSTQNPAKITSFETIFTGSAEAAAMEKLYLIHPNAPAAAAPVDAVKNFILPRRLRLTVTPSASGSFTYSVGYAFVK